MTVRAGRDWAKEASTVRNGAITANCVGEDISLVFLAENSSTLKGQNPEIYVLHLLKPKTALLHVHPPNPASCVSVTIHVDAPSGVRNGIAAPADAVNRVPNVPRLQPLLFRLGSESDAMCSALAISLFILRPRGWPTAQSPMNRLLSCSL